MSRPNFIGTKLINLKDKLSSVPKPVQNEVTAVSTPFGVLKDKEEEHMVKDRNLSKDNQSLASDNTALEHVTLLPEKEHVLPEIEQKSPEKIDKLLSKALKDRKEDYLRTKEVVLKIITETLAEVKEYSEEIENRRNTYLKYIDNLQRAINDINDLNDSKWNDYDFSIELSDAGKVVEHARLESLTCKDKLKMSDKFSDDLIAKSSVSPADIFSSTFSQVFGFGFKLFLPLILGFIAAAIIISLTILFSMGSL